MSSLLHAPLPTGNHGHDPIHQTVQALTDTLQPLLEALPDDDCSGLKAHIGQAAAAVPANIADSEAGGSISDRLCHLSLAKAALARFEVHLLLAVGAGLLGYQEVQDTLRFADEIGLLLGQRTVRLRVQVPTQAFSLLRAG